RGCAFQQEYGRCSFRPGSSGGCHPSVGELDAAHSRCRRSLRDNRRIVGYLPQGAWRIPGGCDRLTNALEVRDLKTHFFTDEGVVKAGDGVSFTVERRKTL